MFGSLNLTKSTVCEDSHMQQREALPDLSDVVHTVSVEPFADLDQVSPVHIDLGERSSVLTALRLVTR